MAARVVFFDFQLLTSSSVFLFLFCFLIFTHFQLYSLLNRSLWLMMPPTPTISMMAVLMLFSDFCQLTYYTIFFRLLLLFSYFQLYIFPRWYTWQTISHIPTKSMLAVLVVFSELLPTRILLCFLLFFSFLYYIFTYCQLYNLPCCDVDVLDPWFHLPQLFRNYNIYVCGIQNTNSGVKKCFLHWKKWYFLPCDFFFHFWISSGVHPIRTRFLAHNIMS